MNEHLIIQGILLNDDETTFSFTEICQQYHMPKEILLEMLEHGLISTLTTSAEKANFNQTMVKRIQSAYRLQCDLGVNSPGAVLALELLDELEQLRKELNILQRQVE
jgi:chaperone modulatory protein CbpM